MLHEIAGHRLLRVLGDGGQGTVYLGEADDEGIGSRAVVGIESETAAASGLFAAKMSDIGISVFDTRAGWRATCTFKSAGGQARVAVAEVGGRTLVVGSGRGVHVWDARTCEKLGVLDEADSGDVKIANLGGVPAAVALAGGEVRAWSLEGGSPTKE